MASHSPYSFALNNPIYLVDEHGDYPKPSKILADFGVELPPLAAGLLDGAFEGSPLGLIGFAADLTDPQFRSDMIEGFKALANDPIGSMKAMFSEYADVLDRVMSGNATAEDEYFIGNEIGSTVSGLLTGGAIKKTFDKLKNIKKGKSALKLEKVVEKSKINKMPAWVKAGKDFEIDLMNKFVKKGYDVVTQVSFTAIDPKTNKKIRAVVDGIVIKNGEVLGFIEAKLTKGKTKLTYNQKIVYEALRKGEATAVGKKAVKAGFEVGEEVEANVHILYKQ